MQNNIILLVSEVMKKNVTNVISLTQIKELKNKIFDYFVEGALLVSNDENQLIGILTDGDVRKSLLLNSESSIEEYITLRPKTILAADRASVALRILREEEINLLPVVDNSNKIIGLITVHMLLKIFSPERLYLTGYEDKMDENEQRHLARYKFALNFIKNDAITLDCACGSGYGSKLLASKSKKVLGIDLSIDAIVFAKKNNSLQNIEYEQGNIDYLKFEYSSLDNIVSIETLEHVPNDVFLRFLDNINLWLKDGGVFIGSSPMLRYKDNQPYITNPFHINEMPKNEFIDSINLKLQNFEIHFYYQDQDTFLPLCKENTGFCIVVARKGKV